MKFLITGAGGFVGTTLVHYALQSGHKVRAVDNFSKGHCDALLHFVNNPGFEFMYGDITCIDQCHKMVQGVDAIVNLAAVVGAPLCAKQPVLAYHVNVEGVSNLLKARDAHNPAISFITASTDSVYGKIQAVCDESTIPNPQSIYGETKLQAEKIVLSHDNTLVVRYSTGAGCSFSMRINLLVNDLVYKAVTDRVLVIFEHQLQRSFINVKDMARAMLHFTSILRAKTNAHRIYNIGDDDLNYTKGQLAELIKEKTNCKIVYEDVFLDPDCRNYVISHDRMYKARFHCCYTMNQTIDELIKAVPLLQLRQQYQ